MTNLEVNRPQFMSANYVLSDPRHAESTNEYQALYAGPEAAAGGVREAVENMSFREKLAVLRGLEGLKQTIVSTVCVAFPADALDGQTNTNWEGLTSHLGYEPEADQPIGFVTPTPDGAPQLIAPVKRRSEESGEYWIVPTRVALHPSQKSVLTETIIHPRTITTDSRQVSVNIKFSSCGEAMGALEQELITGGYEIISEPPRLSSDISLGSIATETTTSTS